MRKHMKKTVAVIAAIMTFTACSGSDSEASDLTTESPTETVAPDITEVPETTEAPATTTDPEPDLTIRLPSPSGPVGPMPVIDNVCDLFSDLELQNLVGQEQIVLGEPIGNYTPGDMEAWEWPENPTEGVRQGTCTMQSVDLPVESESDHPILIVEVRETTTRQGMKTHYTQLLEEDREYADVLIENNDVFDGLYIYGNSGTSALTVWCDNRFANVRQLMTGLTDLELDVDPEALVEFLPILLEAVCPLNYQALEEAPQTTTSVAPTTPATTRPANTPFQGEPVTIDGVQYDCGQIAYSPVVLASGRDFTVDYCNDPEVSVFETITQANPNAFQDFVSNGAKGSLTTANYAPADVAMLGFSACYENIRGTSFNGFEPFVLMYFPNATHQEIFDTYNSAITTLCPPEPIAVPPVQDGVVVPIGQANQSEFGPGDQYGCEQIAFPAVYQDLYSDDDVHASTQCTLAQEAFLSEIVAYSSEYAFHDFVNNGNLSASGFGSYSVVDIAFVGWSACSFAQNGYDTGAYNNLMRSVFPGVTGEDAQIAWDVALTVVCPML